MRFFSPASRRVTTPTRVNKRSVFYRIRRFVKQTLKSAKHKLCGGNPKFHTIRHNESLITLGTEYGGWTFAERSELKNSKIISCGLGEDISFDIEFASRYGARIILIDPTPRAISHFESVQKRFGKTSKVPYCEGGKQPAEAYDLSKLNNNNFKLIKKALWVEKTILKFYAPTNKDHVSHFITNYQNNYREATDFIEVHSTTIDEIFMAENISNVALIKLGIGGSEVDV